MVKRRLDYYDPHRVKLPKALLKKIKIKRLGRLAGFTVWIVDGAVIRGQKGGTPVDVDFALGGNPARYAYVPEGEIWIEWTGDMDDVRAIALHEINEAASMQHGLSYDEAHELASRGETRAWSRGDLPEFTENPASTAVRVFHGTSLQALPEIRAAGITSPLGYHAAGWYMVAEDFASAAFHAEHPGGVVVELLIPTEEKQRGGRAVKAWDGYPYLWRPGARDWDGEPTRWWALRQPLPPEFIVAVHPADDTTRNPASLLTVCAYCKGVIHDGPVGLQGEVSHGMCYDCAVKMADDWGLTPEDLAEILKLQQGGF
jgi:hypothetical protein